jgi:hypothetical protein
MGAFFPARCACRVFMLVEPAQFAVRQRADLAIFDPERAEGWFANDWAVHDCNSLFELHLVAQLVVQVHTAEEQIKLRVGMDPSYRYQLILHLCFEQLQLVGHVAPILVAFLPRNNQGCHDVIPVVNQFSS